MADLGARDVGQLCIFAALDADPRRRLDVARLDHGAFFDARLGQATRAARHACRGRRRQARYRAGPRRGRRHPRRPRLGADHGTFRPRPRAPRLCGAAGRGRRRRRRRRRRGGAPLRRLPRRRPRRPRLFADAVDLRTRRQYHRVQDAPHARRVQHHLARDGAERARRPRVAQGAAGARVPAGRPRRARHPGARARRRRRRARRGPRGQTPPHGRRLAGDRLLRDEDALRARPQH
mmetsp:Transcript_20799/g.70490  ORF Transcript_20799/g.70490 Transcript_20799/m.70490 type:complete len:235 (-) Transcript_20799:514-1218(-)